MVDAIIARYGEIHLKGGNRAMFLAALMRNLRRRVSGRVEHMDARILITDFDDVDQTMRRVTTTFGVTSASIVKTIPSREVDITNHVANIKVTGTFKVIVTRADKSFPVKSMPFAAALGGEVLKQNPTAIVDVHDPKTTIYIDIRSSHTFVYHDTVAGPGGLPVGTSGRAIVLLSGGIDSPVAAFLAAKRGLGVDFVHFFSPPYTSELSLEKVKSLAKILETYTDKSKLYIVPFTEIQEQIKQKCSPEFMITLMRRFMVRIATEIATGGAIGGEQAKSSQNNLKRERVGDHKKESRRDISMGSTSGASCDEKFSVASYHCIITGENLAQVASQTIQGIASNDYLSGRVPILRPLITYDKSEIIQLAKKIGTYQTSIQDHPDCCTLFIPSKPSIKPQIQKLEQEEQKLEILLLVKSAIEGVY